jgi:hypothetical protein
MATFDDHLVTNPAELPEFVIARFTAERAVLAGANCSTCIEGCACTAERGPGCGHYACLGRPDYAGATCPAAVTAERSGKCSARTCP